MVLRHVERVVRGESTSDGAGVRLRRSIGGVGLDHLDPFLLFDEFRSDQPDDYIAGFPDHPHRGFETVTYMLAGHMEHGDHAGNQGDLVAGSIQWMTAGRGIIHSEMPRQENGLMWGFQLWINLPASLKMSPPRYQDISPDRVPVVETEGAAVRVLAGRYKEATGPIEGIVTRPVYLDFSLSPGAVVTHDLPHDHNSFLYVFEGSVRAGATKESPDGTPVGSGHLAVLSPGDAVRIASGGQTARFLLLAAAPIGEPVARYGPFVMNTREELQTAFDQLREGTFLDPE